MIEKKKKKKKKLKDISIRANHDDVTFHCNNALLETNFKCCHHIYTCINKHNTKCTKIPTSLLFSCCYSMQQFITALCMHKFSI